MPSVCREVPKMGERSGSQRILQYNIFDLYYSMARAPTMSLEKKNFVFIASRAALVLLQLLIQEPVMANTTAAFISGRRRHSSSSLGMLSQRINHRNHNKNIGVATTATTKTLQAFKKKNSEKYGSSRNNKKNNVDDDDNEAGWTFNPFDVNDLSPLDTLLRRGFVPFAVRITQSARYEEGVVKYMEKEGCDRATAQRNMDKYFNDPNGWVIAKQRERALGEDFGDINAPTGVQKRPLFSLIWGTFTVWAIFSYFPNQIAKNGGIRPSGFCMTERVIVNGKKVCPKYTPNVFRSMDNQEFLNQVLIEESKGTTTTK